MLCATIWTENKICVQLLLSTEIVHLLRIVGQEDAIILLKLIEHTNVCLENLEPVWADVMSVFFGYKRPAATVQWMT